MAKLSPQGKFRALDSNGDPLVGGKLFTYEAGTTTPRDTYTDVTETVANSNPVILDANGYSNVWLASGAYKYVLTDSADVTQWTEDNISSSAAEGYASSVVTQGVNLNLTAVYQNNLIAATNSLTISLLPVATAQEGFLFAVTNQSSGAITIDPSGSELIDGQSTLVFPKGTSGNVVCDGTQWYSFCFSSVTADSDGAFTGNNSFAGTSTFTGDITSSGKFNTVSDGELTIASGAITPTGTYHTVDTESNAATDDLETISGGVDGQRLIFQIEDDAREVVIVDTGNIVLSKDIDISMASTKESVSFIYSAALSKWVVTSHETPLATETIKGIVQLATDAEVATGTDTVKVPPVSTLGSHQGMAKAWVNFNGTGTVAIRDDYNVSSITDVGTGIYRINFANDMPTVDYSPSVSAPMRASTSASYNAQLYNATATDGSTNLNVGYFEVAYAFSTITFVDPTYYFAQVFGD